MCGIAGYFGNIDRDLSEKLIGRMLCQIDHRGPDGKGISVFDQAGLGHVRLAIIDLAGGAQPMSTSDGRFHVSFNGEIYSYKALKKELMRKGVQLQTDSDTEVLLYLFQQGEVDSVNDLRGMFAFAIWDEKKKKGTLVRDRHGIKPLFYTYSNGVLLFASEIKSLLPVMNREAVMNMNSLHQLMNFRYIPGNKTLFEGIYHLSPGQCLQWHEGNYKLWSWAEPGKAIDDCVDGEDISGMLSQAVGRQLVCDVPLGAYLSGGVDSASLVALAVQGNNKAADFQTFTIQTGDSPLEAENAAKTASLLGVKNFQEPVNIDLTEMMPWLLWHLEVPKVNAVQSALVAKLAQRNVKVALSGLGGDEIFYGYNIHKILCHMHRLRSVVKHDLVSSVGAFSCSLFSRMGLIFEEWSRAGEMLGSISDFSHIYGILRNVWDSPQNRRRIYGPRMLSEDLENPFDFLSDTWVECDDPLKAVADFEMNNKMVNDLLLQEDRLSMAFGLEVRVPFLDEDLVLAVSKIDRKILMPNCKPKHMMREVVSQWLPKEILSRPKSGFQVPIHIFFQRELMPLCDIYLNRKRIVEEGLFNPNFIDEVIGAKPHKNLRWHYFILYLMIGVNIWIDVFQRGKFVRKWN